MKTSKQFVIKSLFLVVMTAVVSGLSLAHNYSTVIQPSAAPLAEASRFDGGSDYVAYCNRCHGPDGRGQTAKGRQTHAGDLTKSRVSDSKAIRMVTNGSGNMPAFNKTMDAARIREVVAYSRTFRR